ALVMIVLFFQRWIVSRGRHEVTQGRGARAQKLRGLPGLATGLVAGLVVVVSLLPLGSIVIGAFTVSRGPVMRWGEWTTVHVERLFRLAPDPVLNTLAFSAVATVIGITFSVIVSYLIVKKRNVLTPLLDYLTALPLALSGTIIGI